jgi:hypothetical protein
MQIINLTPHKIILCGVEYPASGVVARVAMTRVKVGSVGEVPLFKTVFGQVVGLPPAEECKFFLVSAIVRSAVPQRTDVGSPADLVRDAAGQVVGCSSLDINCL